MPDLLFKRSAVDKVQIIIPIAIHHRQNPAGIMTVNTFISFAHFVKRQRINLSECRSISVKRIILVTNKFAQDCTTVFPKPNSLSYKLSPFVLSA